MMGQRERRPVWQIAYLLPLYPLVLAARAFCRWYQERPDA
jgi:hypothetical protein